MNNSPLNDDYLNSLTYSQLYQHLVNAIISDDLNNVKKIICFNIRNNADLCLGQNGPLAIAASNGNLEILQYFFTSVDVDFSPIYPEISIVASQGKQKKIIDYLVNSSDLKTKFDIHFNNDELFRKTCSNLDMVQYLIFDLNIEKTERIEMYLNYLVLNPPNNGKEIIKMFEKRELAEALKVEMTPDNENSQNKKFKL